MNLFCLYTKLNTCKINKKHNFSVVLAFAAAKEFKGIFFLLKRKYSGEKRKNVDIFGKILFK